MRIYTKIVLKFITVTFSYKYYADSTAVEMVPQYLFSKDKIKEHRQAMESRVKKLARQAVDLDEKGKVLLFHWRGGYLTREILAELLEIFDKEAKAKDKRAYVSVNWPQAVLRVRFADGVGEEQLEMEEANEGIHRDVGAFILTVTEFLQFRKNRY